MSVKISWTGVKEIDKALQMMPKELNHATLGSAHLAAGKPVIEKAKLLAPEGPEGNLVDSIGGIKTPMKHAGSVGEVSIGPRRTRTYRGHHGHLVEFGTRPRKNKKGANRGVMPAKPFMEPAFQSTKAKVIENIRVEIGKKVYATMRRYIKR